MGGCRPQHQGHWPETHRSGRAPPGRADAGCLLIERHNSVGVACKPAVANSGRERVESTLTNLMQRIGGYVRLLMERCDTRGRWGEDGCMGRGDSTNAEWIGWSRSCRVVVRVVAGEVITAG